MRPIMLDAFVDFMSVATPSGRKMLLQRHGLRLGSANRRLVDIRVRITYKRGASAAD